ncbi:transcriptional regulator [Xylanimonas oleitrophica]|uniref:Transcriptional regulator n=1 Tax=Xylanimonas oleitrophica TaxID=2607479 RepID=A0A2W5WWD5_9MICO|nr:WYL domain-containing protein [Xylanimonas oleitrophica]PZR52606.1 transcriptional regulator [Xylanimonas oleitrophica]
MSTGSSRLLALLSLLQARRDWPGEVLAERLGVSSRTVRRDVDRLRELGYQVRAAKGPDGGYRLAPGAELPPLLFDDEQAVAIAVALQSVPSSGVDVDDAAARALATVRQVMPSRLRHRVDAIRFAGAEPVERVDPAVLEAVSVAVRDGRTLRFAYRDQDATPRHVEPHAVLTQHGRWYLVAWDLEQADWRIFRLDRMWPRTPAGARFAPRPLPAPDARTFLAARSKGSDVEDRWPCVGVVVLELPASEVAPWAGEGELEVLGERSCRLTVGSWSWTGVLAQVLRFDAPFAVEGPAPLREACAVLEGRLGAAAHPAGV